MTRLRSTLPLALLGVTVLAVPLACGGSDKGANVPVNPGPSATAVASATPTGDPSASASVSATPSATASASASAAPSGSVPSLSDILTTDPAKVEAIAKAAALAATAKMQALGSLPAVEAGLKATAAKTAPGMQPDGELAQGDLKEGEHLTMMVTLQPGKCYAIVGYSPPGGGVKDLDLRLLAPPFYAMLAGEDVTDDNAPTIGKTPNPMCPVIPVGIPYKVDIASEKGAGKVGVMLFSKPNTKK
jgi:hypothetical protein